MPMSARVLIDSRVRNAILRIQASYALSNSGPQMATNLTPQSPNDSAIFFRDHWFKQQNIKVQTTLSAVGEKRDDWNLVM